MINSSSKFRSIRRLMQDRAGNFGILTAIAIPVAAAAAGVAVDVSNMTLSNSELQEATDAAALATATALANNTATTSNAQQLASDFVVGQMSNYIGNDENASNALKAGTSATVTQTTNSSGGVSYSVAVNASYPMQVNGMTHMLGVSTMNISASSTSSSGTAIQKSALSMYLVLDHSGSMADPTDTINAQQPTVQTCTTKKGQTTCTTSKNYYTKIESLKLAVANLMAQMNKADPNAKYVRTGGDSYSSKADSPTSPLAWGTSAILTYVNKLSASGNTDSSGAFTNAYNALHDPKETQAHVQVNGQTNPGKYIVFMTDGDNTTGTNPDGVTKAYCDKAKGEGMQVYTIAFMAPAKGQALLSACATSPSTYFTPQNAADLLAAFQTIGAQASKQLTLLNK